MEKGQEDWYSKTWYNESKSAVYLLTSKIILDWIKNNNFKNMLDIGCGYGVLTKLLHEKTNLKITAIDYEKNALKKTKNILINTDVKIEEQNVLDMKYKDNSFDLVISTGYTSAATLPGAMREIKRIVKPGGMIIVDYLRFYNLYYFLSGNFFKRLIKYLNKKDTNQYYFGMCGLKKYLEKENELKIEKVKSFYTFPPFLKKYKQKLIFERTIGAMLKPFLARVLILKLRNTK